ncbi:MAG: DUF72 domain-containing protein [Candidatus Hydrogenedentes bacterium]|nr:DUF72 domain-containing protein [Candidatus Hydrogenedentota bacterium]
MTELRIGISGWVYEPWRKTFYPNGLPQKRELEYASRQLNTIEINGSFYSLQSVASWQRWYAETPDNFVFSVKASRFITHLKRLRGIDAALPNFFAQGILALEKKLGPILWQFPPNFSFDPERIEAFFKILPRDTKAAATLARKHDARLKGRSFYRVKENRPMRHAMEIRHKSFRSPDFIALLRKYNVALVVADTAGKWPYLEDVTADFVYARLHGDEKLYVSGYTPKALDRWAARVLAWSKGREPEDAHRASIAKAHKERARDVYVYFDNDVKVRAPYDAIGLAQRVGGFVPAQFPSPITDNLPEEPPRPWPGTRNAKKKVASKKKRAR